MQGLACRIQRGLYMYGKGGSKAKKASASRDLYGSVDPTTAVWGFVGYRKQIP